MAADAMPRSARPNATRGVGVSRRARANANTWPHPLSRVFDASVFLAWAAVPGVVVAVTPGRRSLPSNTSSASRASPTVPLTYRSSPALAPLRSRAWERPLCTGTSPNTVIQMFSGPAVVSPPISSQPCVSANSKSPCENDSSQGSFTSGSESASVKASGLAPHAARSLRFTASALWPRVRGSTSAKKCRPCTSMSQEMAN